MPTWYDVDGSDGGHIAIYTGNDDAPMSNPSAYIGTRTKFSTKFNYIPFVPAKRITATISVPETVSYSGRGDPMQRIINLGAHGMPGVPFIRGFATIAGVIRPICGSIPLRESGSSGSGAQIFWTLGVDATNVFIDERRAYPDLVVTYPSVPVEVFISDKVIIP
jgi:hypothetical protein